MYIKIIHNSANKYKLYFKYRSRSKRHDEPIKGNCMSGSDCVRPLHLANWDDPGVLYGILHTFAN